MVAQQVPVKMHDERFALPKKPHSGSFITVVYVFVYVFGVLGPGRWTVGRIQFSWVNFSRLASRLRRSVRSMKSRVSRSNYVMDRGHRMTFIQKRDSQGALNDLIQKAMDRGHRMTLIRKRDGQGAPNDLDSKM